MQHEILGAPDFGMVSLSLEAGESVRVEPGAMASMSGHIKIETKAEGGMLAGIKRMASGESFFVNTYTAEGAPGRLDLAPPTPGDLIVRELAGETLFMSSGCFMAAQGDIEVDAKFGGVKGFFGGTGLMMLRVSGTGTLFGNGYGALHEMDVDGDMIIDNGHIAAYEDGLDFSIEAVKGIKGFLFSGEGLVCRFRGKGKVWVQTRNPTSFADWINPFRRVESSN